MDDLILVVCVGIAFAVVALMHYARYHDNVQRLNALTDARRIKPGKARFIFAWCTFYLLGIIAGSIVLWLIEKEIFYVLLLVMFSQMISFAPTAYPYYTIAIHHNSVNGPTRWGWLWKRIDIQLGKIDRAKTLRPTLGRKLGFTTIFSDSGEKILTLGLDDQQLTDILQAAEKQASV